MTLCFKTGKAPGRLGQLGSQTGAGLEGEQREGVGAELVGSVEVQAEFFYVRTHCSVDVLRGDGNSIGRSSLHKGVEWLV